jgi:hypothetical protein
MIGVARRDLGPLDPIDSDAVSYRYALGEPRVGLPYPLVYREVRPDRDLPHGVTPEEVRAAFGQAVALRERCSAADQVELDRRTDWPLTVVTQHDSVVGVLMPGVPDDFFVAGRRVLTLRDLCASDEAAAANDLDRSAVDDDLVRLALAAHLAQTIHLLHRNRIAYSDLALGQVAIASHPPRTILVGCDPTLPLRGAPAARSGRRAPLPDLDPSRLALCVIRALAKGPGATQLTDPARVGGLLGGAGVSLVARALAPPAGTPAAAKPSAEQLSRYLVGRLAELLRERGLIDPATTVPGFDIAAQLRGTLPRLAVPSLPTVAVPQTAAPLPRRPMVDSEEHPPPRIQVPAVDLDVTAIRGGLAANGSPDVHSMIAREYVDAYHQLGATLRDRLRTLRGVIDERMTRAARAQPPHQPDPPGPDPATVRK